jgi:hypothetical protein
MKVTIDEKVCTKQKMTPQEVMISLAVRSLKKNETLDKVLENMLKREILVKEGDRYLITQHWNDVVDEVLADSSGSCKKTPDELMNLAVRIQECFPKMAQPDKFGRPTKYFFRCNKREIMLSLKRFYEAYGEVIEDVTDDDIIDATRRYVAEGAKEGYRGMRLSKYFIFKNEQKKDEDGIGHIEQVSDLMTYLENKESEVEAETNDDSWLMNSRN